jgi:hypothetical protein
MAEHVGDISRRGEGGHRANGTASAATRTADPPSLCPSSRPGHIPAGAIACPAATRSSASAARVEAAKFPPLAPTGEVELQDADPGTREALGDARSGRTVLSAGEAVGKDRPPRTLARGVSRTPDKR